MPQWNTSKSPDLFPAFWHSIICQPPGRTLVGEYPEASAIEAAKSKFNAFKACLRAHPSHPSAQAMAKRTYRLSGEVFEGIFYLWVTVKWADSTLTDLLREAVEGKSK